MKDYIKTSDTSLAAYLMLHGYTHMKCIDNGETGRAGYQRIEHYLTHADDEVRERLLEHYNELRESFETEGSLGFKQYYINLRRAKKATHYAICGVCLTEGGMNTTNCEHLSQFNQNKRTHNE